MRRHTNSDGFLESRETLMAALALPPVDNHTHTPVKDKRSFRFICHECGNSIPYEEVFNA
jgi:hypothetical protein